MIVQIMRASTKTEEEFFNCSVINFFRKLPLFLCKSFQFSIFSSRFYMYKIIHLNLL